MLIQNLFLGAGAMKSGTTWLYHVLGHHPGIYFSYEKEVHYFAHANAKQIRLTDQTRLQNTRQALQRINPSKQRAQETRKKLLWYANYLSSPIDDSWYANLFSFRQEQRYCADFSNLYCHLDKAGWDHVKRVGANVKVLYLLREPLDRLWSHIRFHLHITGRLSELENWKKEDWLAFSQQPYIQPNGEYAANIVRMRENLDSNQLKIGFFEDLHRDHRGWLKGLEDFLELPHFDYPDELLSLRINESPPAAKPDFFNEIFGDFGRKQKQSLADIGFVFPADRPKS